MKELKRSAIGMLLGCFFFSSCNKDKATSPTEQYHGLLIIEEDELNYNGWSASYDSSLINLTVHHLYIPYEDIGDTVQVSFPIQHNYFTINQVNFYFEEANDDSVTYLLDPYYSPDPDCKLIFYDNLRRGRMNFSYWLGVASYTKISFSGIKN